MKVWPWLLVRALCTTALTAAASPPTNAQSGVPAPSQLLGTWRGTSLCSDRVAAPACNDETVVYEFTPGPKPGEVHWAADKVVDGKRVPMGEFDLAYDKPSACWRSEFKSPFALCAPTFKFTPQREGRSGPGTSAASPSAAVS